MSDRKAVALNALVGPLSEWSLGAMKQGASTQVAGEAQLLAFRLAETLLDATDAANRLDALTESLPQGQVERLREVLDKWGEEHVSEPGDTEPMGAL